MLAHTDPLAKWLDKLHDMATHLLRRHSTTIQQGDKSQPGRQSSNLRLVSDVSGWRWLAGCLLGTIVRERGMKDCIMIVIACPTP